MSVNRRRWWLLRAMRRGRIARPVDRVEAWAAIACLLAVMFAAHPAADLARSVQTTNAAAFAREAATRHVVDSVAVAPSQTATRGVGSVYQVQVEWFARNETRTKVVRVDHAVNAGERIPLWIDDEGLVTTAPRTDVDARADAVAVGTIVWLIAVAAAVAALTVLRRVLDRVRYRAWDRGLLALVDDDGGRATRNS